MDAVNIQSGPEARLTANDTGKELFPDGMHNVGSREVESPTGHHDVVDARFPERWLNDTRITRLSGDAFKLFGLGLIFAVANKREGFLYEDDLEDIKRVDRSRIFELEQAGLWKRDGNGWRLDEYSETQTSLAELEASARARVLARDRKVRQRKKERAEDEGADGLMSRVTSQARPGQDRTGVEGGTPNTQQQADEGWPDVAPVGEGVDSPSAWNSGRTSTRTTAFASGGVKDREDWPVGAAIPAQPVDLEPQAFAIFDRMASEAGVGEPPA